MAVISALHGVRRIEVVWAGYRGQVLSHKGPVHTQPGIPTIELPTVYP